VGTNNGYAYIEPDVRCASPSYGAKWIEIDWRRADNDEPLKGVEQRYSGCQESFDDYGNQIGVVFSHSLFSIFSAFFPFLKFYQG
jgi:hypothetical protein